MLSNREILLGLALRHANNWDKMCDELKGHHFELSDEEIESVKNFSTPYITILDSNYPNRLKQRPKPPLVLYYDGDISLLDLVDRNNFKNDLVFLHGPNVFNIPESRLCVITADNKIDICGGLRVWFNKESTNLDRFGLAAGLCQSIVCSKVYREHTRSWFLGITIPNALYLGCDIYIKPSITPSYNNQLIKDGAFLIDSYEDIRR